MGIWKRLHLWAGSTSHAVEQDSYGGTFLVYGGNVYRPPVGSTTSPGDTVKTRAYGDDMISVHRRISDALTIEEVWQRA